MKLTMKEIAKMVGVSVTAVSLVLNNKPTRISAEKVKKIKAIAAQYNYVPNASAVSLAKNQSNNIGVIVPNVGNPFYASLMRSVGNDLINAGYYPLMINTEDNHDNERRQLEKLISRGVDGILLVPSNDLYHQGELYVRRFLEEIEIPFVLVNADSDLAISQVNLDSFQGGYLATQNLIQNGHREIAIVAGGVGFVNAEARLSGYKKALADNGIKYRDQLVFRGDYSRQGGYESIQKIEKQASITAIFFCNDLMLYGAIQKFNEQSRNLFERYSVIGYDDSFINQIFHPSISSVKQNVKELGSQAVEILYQRLNHQQTIQKKLPVALNERDSVRRLT